MNWNTILSTLVFFLALHPAAKSQISTTFFEHAHRFLNTHVQGDLFDYQAASEDDQLQHLISQIANADLSNENELTKQAFYINAYNLLVIHAAIQAQPTSSVLKVKGFFDDHKHVVAGEKLTLNELEKERLFKLRNDARFHFVLVCGAMGCPPLANFAYTPDELEKQLDNRTMHALNDPNFIRFKGKEVKLSKIFEWYAQDFGNTQTKIIDYINQYRLQKLPKGVRVGYYEYDWTINDISSGSSG